MSEAFYVSVADVQCIAAAMDSLLISTASGMKARMESLEMLANNLANLSTSGFKLDRESFSLYASPEAESGNGSNTISQSPILERHRTDLSQGSLTETGSPLTVGLSGPGFLRVTKGSDLVYTRNGQLRIGAAGSLETSEGYGLRNRQGKPIIVDPLQAVDIDRQGIIRQGNHEIGQIDLVAVDNPDQMEKLGATYFMVSPSASVHSSDAEVRQGYIENSNVNPADASIRLVSVMRQFEMLQRAMQLGADMNRKAIDEVAKVS
ncbi:MAG: flagellar hook basal-body protein [Bryobacteraceae bacterium]